MTEDNTEKTERWQLKLLPFMIRTIVFLSLFFFIASLTQLIYLHWVISQRPWFDGKEALSTLVIKPGATQSDVIQVTRTKALIMLEAGNLDDQYHQANVLLMGRLWSSYIGFVTGMILAIVGATFILGKLRESQSELGGKVGGNEVTFKSASPGLVLAVLGTILMVTTIVTHHEIDVKHNAIYIRDIPAVDTYTVPPPMPPKPDLPKK